MQGPDNVFEQHAVLAFTGPTMARMQQLMRASGAQRRYWERQLAGAPLLLELPTDKARPAQPSGRGSSVPVLLPAEVTAALRDLAAKCGVTMFVAVTAAWQACPASPLHL